MDTLREQIDEQLNCVQGVTASDFSALAWVGRDRRNICWKYASGNVSERYKHMIGRSGHGLAGSVVRFGRNIVVDAANPDDSRKRLEYPIMLAENLYAAAAIPVRVKGETWGVLLAGSRSRRIYTDKDIQYMVDVAGNIAGIIIKRYAMY